MFALNLTLMKYNLSFLLFILMFTLSGSISAQKNKTWLTEGFIIQGGASINSFSVKGSDMNQAPVGTKFKSSVSPVIIAGYLTEIGDTPGELFLYPQLKISSFKNSGSQDVRLTTGTVYQNVKTTQKATTIFTVLGFGYCLVNRKDFNLLVSAGPVFSLLIGSKQIKEKRNASTGIVTTEEGKAKEASYNFNAELTAFFKNKFVIWISTGTPTSTTSYVTYNSKLVSIQGGIGYKF